MEIRNKFNVSCHLFSAVFIIFFALFVTTFAFGHRLTRKAISFLTGIQPEKCTQDPQRTILCLRTAVRVLGGVIPSQRRFLTVGLSSVKRQKENYLLQTVHSIFNQSSEEELSEMVVVVLLADFDLPWVYQTLASIKELFPDRLIQGQLLVIHADELSYPPLTGLKRNFNDAPDRVTFRSKQNIDYAYLVDFSARFSAYYIMLEDDVSCSKGFLSSIRDHIVSHGRSPWVTLEFSKLGYIGKLYHSEDLPRLAYFLYLFYQEMPCDFLLVHFRTLLMQDKVIRFRPSLFQHMGTFSSFQGTYNRLKDDEFHDNPADNPPANVHTDIPFYKTHYPEEAYSQGSNYFWSNSPINVGNWFVVAFEKPVILSRVVIQTGQDGVDILQSANVELGESVLRTVNKIDCTNIRHLGGLDKGYFDLQDIHQTVTRPVLCLKMSVTASQSNWVIIRSIRVWLKK